MQRPVRLTLMSLALMAASTLSGATTREDNLPSASSESTDADKNVRKSDADGADGATKRPVAELPPQVLCNTLVAAAQSHGLPISFFSNLIWQESRLVFNAVSHAGALGIAQFMPKTAAAVGLADPFDPLQALPASARLLHDLFERYGNLGLAAAAYNAGEGRLNRWLSKQSVLPRETRDYVLTITGLPVERWKVAAPRPQSFKLAAKMPCRDHEAFAAEVPEATTASVTSKPSDKLVAKRDMRKATGLNLRNGKRLSGVRTAARDERTINGASRHRPLARTATRRAGNRSG